MIDKRNPLLTALIVVMPYAILLGLATVLMNVAR